MKLKRASAFAQEWWWWETNPVKQSGEHLVPPKEKDADRNNSGTHQSLTTDVRL